MRVAVFLSGFTPDMGGGYTFQADLYRALADGDAVSQHEFRVLCDTRAVADFARRIPRARNVSLHTLGPRSVTERFGSVLRRELPGLRRFFKSPGRI